jgi:hypothetical protein
MHDRTIFVNGVFYQSDADSHNKPPIRFG